MEWEIYLFVILPAAIALVLKAGLFAYAYHSRTRNPQTRIYMALLALLFVQNLALIPGYIEIAAGHTPYQEATLFYLTEILAVAVLLHLAASLAFESGSRAIRLAAGAVYPSALLLAGLLLFSRLLIRGYAFHHFIVTRVPGPLYFLLELYAMVAVGGAVGALLRGAYRQESPQGRLKNSTLLLAILPMAAVIIAVVILLHLGATWINVSSLQPVLTTYFLIVTAYATHQHRLFDIQFYIPWSKERRRKTAFYGRIRQLVAEIADLASSGEILDRLATTLGCPVALVGPDLPILAEVGGSRRMAEIPRQVLDGIDQIVVANEIADSNPESCRSLRRHGIAAVVPFHPRSQHAAGWLLLGGSFSEQVYTRLDFKMVEQLFERMADLFLDKLLVLRTQLYEASRSIHELQNRQRELEASMDSLRRHNEALQRQNASLQQERPLGSIAAAAASELKALSPDGPLAAAVTLLGRDKALLRNLRLHFPQLDHYVGLHSAGFQRQSAPDILVVRIDAVDDKAVRELPELLGQRRGQVAALLYGPAASAFAAVHREKLLGSLTEILPDGAWTAEAAARAIRGLAVLRQATYAVHDPEQPLIGQSETFAGQMAAASSLAGFNEPLLLRTADMGQAVALARHMHAASGRSGPFRALLPAIVADDESDLGAETADLRGGTILIPCFCGSPADETRMRSRAAHLSGAGVRVITACDVSAGPHSPLMHEEYPPLCIDMPRLSRRQDDGVLLVRYFILQFNLQSGVRLGLSRAEAGELLTAVHPETVAALKRAVFHALGNRLLAAESAPAAAAIDVPAAGSTLDDYVTAFEARIIAQTLERCGGNKSKAARLLGLRPNTLHYKLERYNIPGAKVD